MEIPRRISQLNIKITIGLERNFLLSFKHKGTYIIIIKNRVKNIMLNRN